MIRFEDVSFSYMHSDEGTDALHSVTLSVATGQTLAVIGANGSGKSTLARLCNALLIPRAGTVLIDGKRTTDMECHSEIRQLVGMVFQRPDDQIVATSVEDEVAFGPGNLGLSRDEIRGRVRRALAATGLEGLETREPHQLSGGQKQRLAVAGALAMNPRYIVLDEPTSMLDSGARADVLAVLEALRNEGHGVLLITHDLAEAVRADRVAVLSEGSVVFEGAPYELLKLDDRELEAWGLERPTMHALANALVDAGLEVPGDTLQPDAIAGALCR